MFAVLHIADFALHAVLRTEPVSNETISSIVGQRAGARSKNAPASGLPAVAPFGFQNHGDIGRRPPESAPDGRPAALLDGARKKALVLATTDEARAAGVEPGMTAPQALARCATLLIRTPQPAAEAEARAALLAVGFTLSPAIEDTAPGICTIDLKGADAKKLVPTARAAVAELVRLGLPATAGIAATPLLALYAARAVLDRNRARALNRNRSPAAAITSTSRITSTSDRETNDDAFLSPTALSTQPSALNPVLLVTDAAAFLAPLPLAAADPTPELAGILASWGLRTLSDLTRLSRDDLGRRLGPAGLALWDRAAGGAWRPLHPVAPPQTFAAAMEFENEVETLEPLLFILRRFLDRLALELRATVHVAAELALTLTLADGLPHARSFRLPEPTADADLLFRVLHTHLESLHTDAAIHAVALHVTPARPLVRQQGLFETGLRDPHGFAETLARIGAIVGSDRIGTPELEDTHRPDAVKLTPPAAVVPPPGPPPVWPPLGLPLRRFRPPLTARLELTTGRPTYLWTERFQGAIATIRGPWRGSGDWWQSDRAWQRIEYDVALADGGLYRLLRTGDDWFIEGEYD